MFAIKNDKHFPFILLRQFYEVHTYDSLTIKEENVGGDLLVNPQKPEN
jgi:hypothetical protein